jgi:hypothetical protein
VISRPIRIFLILDARQFLQNIEQVITFITDEEPLDDTQSKPAKRNRGILP